MGIAVLCLSLTSAAAQDSGFQDNLATTPGIVITYYDVMGSNPEEIQAAMKRQNLRANYDSQTHDAITRWKYSWKWRSWSNGTCDLSNAKVKFSAKVLLPRLANYVQPDLARRWHKFLVALRIHEEGHITIARSHQADLRAAIQSSSCSTANAAAQRVIGRIKSEEYDYDVRTHHGATQGAVFP